MAGLLAGRRARDSFRLDHDVKKPTIRLDGHWRLQLPRVGSIRIHGSGKRLARLIAKGQAVIQTVTVSRGGNRWYASVLAKVQQDSPDKPSRPRPSVEPSASTGASHTSPRSPSPSTPPTRPPSTSPTPPPRRRDKPTRQSVAGVVAH